MRFRSSDIEKLRGRAEAVGLATWPAVRHPTSSYTHGAMLDWFSVDRESLHFQHMADPETALYANTYRVHYQLLKPWVKCSLDINCLAPVGSQV